MLSFDLHLVIISFENLFLVFFLSGSLGQVLLYGILLRLKTLAFINT